MSVQELIGQIESLGSEFAAAISALTDEQEIRATQAQFLGTSRLLLHGGLLGDVQDLHL